MNCIHVLKSIKVSLLGFFKGLWSCYWLICRIFRLYSMNLNHMLIWSKGEPSKKYFKLVWWTMNIYTYWHNCYTSNAIYWFLDAILRSCVLWDSANNLYFVNKQVKQFQNSQLCNTNQKMACVVILCVYYEPPSFLPWEPLLYNDVQIFSCWNRL